MVNQDVPRRYRWEHAPQRRQNALAFGLLRWAHDPGNFEGGAHLADEQVWLLHRGKTARAARAVTFERLEARLARAVTGGEIATSIDIHAFARFVQVV